MTDARGEPHSWRRRCRHHSSSPSRSGCLGVLRVGWVLGCNSLTSPSFCTVRLVYIVCDMRWFAFFSLFTPNKTRNHDSLSIVETIGWSIIPSETLGRANHEERK
jgi:hypothetical protein